MLLVRRDGKNKAVHRGKEIPLEDWTGPEVSRRFRMLDFKTIYT
jgi:hypothetical protein